MSVALVCLPFLGHSLQRSINGIPVGVGERQVKRYSFFGRCACSGQEQQHWTRYAPKENPWNDKSTALKCHCCAMGEQSIGPSRFLKQQQQDAYKILQMEESRQANPCKPPRRKISRSIPWPKWPWISKILNQQSYQRIIFMSIFSESSKPLMPFMGCFFPKIGARKVGRSVFACCARFSHAS